MKKISLLLCLLFVCSFSFSADNTDAPKEKTCLTVAQRKKAFKARRKQIKQLVKKYKKAHENEKPAIKTELEKLVSENVDEWMNYLKKRVASEQQNLDNWKTRIEQDEANLPQLKAQRVDDLLTGAAKQKHKEAKKAWKKQLKQAKDKWQ